MLFWINLWVISMFSAAVNLRRAEVVPQWRADLQIHNRLSSVPLDCTYHAPLSFAPDQKTLSRLSVTFSLAPPLQSCSFSLTPSPHILKEKGDLFQKPVFKSFYIQFFDLNTIYHFQELKAKVTEVTFTLIIQNENGHNFPKIWPFFVSQVNQPIFYYINQENGLFKTPFSGWVKLFQGEVFQSAGTCTSN